MKILDFRLNYAIQKYGHTMQRARQIVNHGHIFVNNFFFSYPSFICSSSSIIVNNFFKMKNKKEKKKKRISEKKKSEIKNFDTYLIVEYYSNRI